MALRIEDYGLIGDCQTAALVGRDGSIDWLCVPRFDSGACFAALLGTPEHGRWLVAPAEGVEVRAVHRRYRGSSLVLETDFETEHGAVRLIDFMPIREKTPDLVRIVVGLRGEVPMRTELVLRFDYGSNVPWVQHRDHTLTAIAGPDMVRVKTDVPLRGHGFRTEGKFTVKEGQRVPFNLAYYPSYGAEPQVIDPEQALEETDAWWREWSRSCTVEGEHREAVLRSLITLKAMTYAPSGGIVAAPTTSLPEQVGGTRNWDYRFCWLRDATLTLTALRAAGFHEEAEAWIGWLRRAVAGRPSNMQILYGVAGERRIGEVELPWLPGYEGSRPVRVGNAAHEQFQLDVYGEVVDSFFQGRRAGTDELASAWDLERVLLDYLESAWHQPDEGIWEVRGPRRHFTHSKVMAWVAFDRAVRSVEKFGLEGPVDRWRAIRDEIHAEVCREGYNASLGSFVQSYGSDRLDAALLMIPLVGFLPPTDERVAGTVAAIEQRLVENGFVNRYDSASDVDGLPHGEATFLPCSFWLADNYALMGRVSDARAMFERLLSIRNDLGLLAEEYDTKLGRLVGNFPQAFSHIGLVNTAINLARGRSGPAEQRTKG